MNKLALFLLTGIIVAILSGIKMNPFVLGLSCYWVGRFTSDYINWKGL